MSNDWLGSEDRWQEAFADVRRQFGAEWTDFALEVLTALGMAGRIFDEGFGSATVAETLTRFLGQRRDVLDAAIEWAQSGDIHINFLEGAEHSNERALVVLRQVKRLVE